MVQYETLCMHERNVAGLRRHPRALVFLLALLFLMPGAAQERTVYEAHEQPPFAPGTPTMNVYVCDLTGADSLLVESQGQTMLVDCGKENQVPQILAMLGSLGITHLNAIFSTHPHSDHVGGVPLLLDQVTVGQFYTVFAPDASGPGLHQRSAVRALNEAGVPVVQVTQGDVIAIGDARATVYHQPKAKTVNQQSGMLHVRFGDRTMLLTGDVEGLTQTRFGERFDLKSDILKYPHHGLLKLNTPFLASVSPELAIIPHGMIGSERAQAQLRKQQISYRFASWGVIALSTDGRVWRVAQELTEAHADSAREHGIPLGGLPQ